MPNDADRNSRMSTIGSADAQFDEAERHQQTAGRSAIDPSTQGLVQPVVESP